MVFAPATAVETPDQNSQDTSQNLPADDSDSFSSWKSSAMAFAPAIVGEAPVPKTQDARCKAVARDGRYAS